MKSSETETKLQKTQLWQNDYTRYNMIWEAEKHA